MVSIILNIILWYVILLWDFEFVLSNKKKKDGKESISYLYFMYQGLILGMIQNGNVVVVDWFSGSEDEVLNRLNRIVKK